MAQGVEFPEQNDCFGKPKSMTENQCYSLPVCRIMTFIPGPTDHDKAQQVLAHVSCWQLSDEELAEVVKTGKVYLKVIGGGMMPVSIHGKKPIYVNDGDLSDKVLSKEEVLAMKGQ